LSHHGFGSIILSFNKTIRNEYGEKLKKKAEWKRELDSRCRLRAERGGTS
jgi:hypothetical protein